MKKVLLVIAPERQSTEALHYALHKTREMQGGLRVVYIGDGIEKEFPVSGKKLLEAVEKQARTFQVPVETELKSGGYFEICGDLSRREDVALMVVTEKKGSLLKKVFEDSEAKRLKDRVSCEIKVY